jgi:hypothetical protein
MGHKTPTYQPSAARITLQRYAYLLPGELERARELLNVSESGLRRTVAKGFRCIRHQDRLSYPAGTTEGDALNALDGHTL